MKLMISCCLAASLLTSCVTPYGPHSLLGGYSETQVGDVVWHVSFSGNGYTSSTLTYRYALRRAAELCLRASKSYFLMLNEQSDSDYMTYTAGSVTHLISKPTSDITIQCVSEDLSGRAYSTAVLIGGKVGKPQ